MHFQYQTFQNDLRENKGMNFAYVCRRQLTEKIASDIQERDDIYCPVR